MTTQRVRVRFAPSPTGALHIGGVRTALYNYLFAKQHNGDFIFRIEDTDSNRFVPGAEEYIIESFKWLGVEFDEGVSFGGNYGPYRQSERRDIYKKYVDVLLNNGKAYIAFDTPEELEAKRAEVANFQYDATTRGVMRNSLTLSAEEVKQLIDSGHQYVVRFKIEPNEDVRVDDLIRGEVVINSSVLDDKVLYKSADELPTYHLANIVDDHLMEVSHVIRGEEWLPSAPLHVLLYRAFGWEDTMPRFAHLPLLLKPEGNGKLSKRDGDRLGFPVFPLEWKDPKTGDVSSGYRESGYLPQAVLNFLALLGWNPGDDKEIMSLDEMISLFDLSRCSKSGAKFDYKKGMWFNHQYIQSTPNSELALMFMPILEENGVKADVETVTRVVELTKSRVNFVKELWEASSFFFVAPTAYDEKTVKKRWKEDIPQVMSELIDLLNNMSDFSAESQEKAVMDWIATKEYHAGNVMNAFRLAVVGEGKGPHMFDITNIIGKEETIKRIKRAVEVLG
ncbi:MAG: glutamate--tRNA ligase [Bacteroides sp.]|nr:glutamate--tRNA ligase [Bacteroides sp.]